MSQQQFLPIIDGVAITTDKEDRFNLNALHKASTLGKHKAPSEWLRRQETKELIEELEQTVNLRSAQKTINAVNGGSNPGTFTHELLAISYAVGTIQ